MRPIPAVLALFALALAAPCSDLCPSWGEGRTLGVLDSRLVPEASGLAVSSDGSRLYHVNDSGDGPFVYVSRLDGGDLRRLRLDGAASLHDAEALALADLGGQPTLVVADIGDNRLARRDVVLIGVREAAIGEGRAPAFRQVRARYPDGPHNAEGLAAAPGGDLYIFTKSWSDARTNPLPSRIYRLAASAWRESTPPPALLELVGELDLPALAARERAPFSDVVTDVSMSQDGSRFLVLTYGYAWEFALDLRAGPVPPAASLQRGRDYELIRIRTMLGKETIAYLPGGRAFLFGKEYKPDSKPSEIVRVDCQAAP